MRAHLLGFRIFYYDSTKRSIGTPKEVESLERVKTIARTMSEGGRSTPEAFIPGAGGLAEFYMWFVPLDVCDIGYRRSKGEVCS